MDCLRCGAKNAEHCTIFGVYRSVLCTKCQNEATEEAGKIETYFSYAVQEKQLAAAVASGNIGISDWVRRLQKQAESLLTVGKVFVESHTKAEKPKFSSKPKYTDKLI